MTLEEWLTKEGIGNYGQHQFKQWLTHAGYKIITRSDREWGKLWGKFLDNMYTSVMNNPKYD